MFASLLKLEPFVSLQDFFDIPNKCRSFKVDINETDDQYELTAEVPGFTQDDINIEIQNKVLTITCERQSSKDEENRQYRIQERYFGKTSRSFSVPSVDEQSVTANLENGVLKVVMKKTEKRTKKIEVKVS